MCILASQSLMWQQTALMNVITSAKVLLCLKENRSQQPHKISNLNHLLLYPEFLYIGTYILCSVKVITLALLLIKLSIEIMKIT